MADLPGFNTLFRVARDEALVRSSKISRDAIERDGTDANILVASAAAVGDEVTGQVASLQAGLFLDSAKREQLDRLVFDRYNMVRKPASASMGSARFSTPTPTGVAFTIPTGVKLSTPDGKQFITVESTIFPVASVGPIIIGVRSVLAGGDQNVKAGQITSLVTPVTSAPANLVVTNSLATAGGDDAENDESLRDRARRFFTTVQRGTLAALELAALDVPGVRKATAIEVIDSLGRPARICQLIIADAFTEQFVTYDVVPPRYQVQSQFLSVRVFNTLAEVRPAGIFVQVIVSNVVLQSLQLALTFNAGTDVALAALLARAAIVNYVNELAPGQTFVYQDAVNVLARVPGLAQSGNNIVSPAGNIDPKALQVIRTSLGLVSAVAAQTNQPIITGSNPDAFTLAA